MTQEDKNILLKDLSARLPYGVKFQGEDSNVYTLDASNYFTLQVEGVVFKPHLRPVSSMTAEEKEDFGVPFTSEGLVTLADTVECIDWLNAHHFDFHNLIEKGLAIDCTNLNIY